MIYEHLNTSMRACPGPIFFLLYFIQPQEEKINLVLCAFLHNFVGQEV